MAAMLVTAPVAAQDGNNGSFTIELIQRRTVVTLVGASVTNGVDMRAESALQMGLKVPEGQAATVSLRQVLSAAFNRSTEIVFHDASEKMFFAISDQDRETLFTRAIATEPDLLVALDFLFWYGYGPLEGKGAADSGDHASAEEAERATRLAHLEQGLALISKFKGNLLIGNFPDMSAANRLVLNPKWRPDAATLKELNARVAAFAKERPGTILFPLAEQVADLQTRRRTIRFGEDSYDVGRDQLFQFDRLHPNRVGMAVLGEALLTRIAEFESLPKILRPTPPQTADLILALEATEQLRKAKLIEQAEGGDTPVPEKVR